MKEKLTIIFLIFFALGNAQHKPIEEFLPAIDLGHTGCVKRIKVHHFRFYSDENETDTIFIQHLAKYEGNKLVKRESFYRNNPNLRFEVFYDTLGRVTKLKRTNNYGEKQEIFQHFSNNSQYPDSTTFYYNDKKKEFYLNTFQDTLVSKQEHYRKDTLRTYSKFRYDEDNRLIEHIKVNTNNGFGITLGKGITGTTEIKTLYPNDSITYDYSSIEDTLVRKKYNKGELNEIFKTITNDQYLTEIVKKYDWGYYSKKIITKKYKDSTEVLKYRFLRNRDTTIVTREKRKSNKITLNWTDNNKSFKSDTVVETKSDNRGNWIKKSIVRDGVLEEKILREISYCR